MDRTIDFSSDWPWLLFYASQLAGLSLVLCFVVFPLEGPVDVLIAVPFALLVVAVAVGLWRRVIDGDERDHLGTADDITHDPYADPGQAARDRWERAIRRLPDGDGDDERD
ncbi:hypothetical protein A6E15_02785 [Natrinema saccharevitans]|uniref:Uncharacterized protein n=1 Tax=Natrinema saccharevitans TaxID=301967 RepID=A0A1S8ATW7_9EURY|nr:hypothetical protein [Natrinema saccharevitans]OLZ39971.1 hypothetical protein A6E15_02785 [Natrinema saccharevitans]